MGGGGTKTETVTSGMNNAQLNQAVSTIGTQLNTQLGNGVKGYEGSLVPAMSSQTQAGINSLTNNPNSSIYSAGIGSAIASQADIAGGNIANDAVRQRIADDAGVYANATFANSGRFGSGSHREGLGEGIAGALAAHDYGRQQQAIQNLPGLYQASMMPASANLQAGNMMDAYNAAQAQEAARLFDVKNNAGWGTLERAGGILGTTSGAAGTTTSQTTPTAPWWQQALGYVAGNAGKAFGMM